MRIEDDLGVSSWNFEEQEKAKEDEATGDNEQEASSYRHNHPSELAGTMKRHQKEARKVALKDDREWQRSRRHDEWDREYDRGKLKKVKSTEKP